MSAALNRASLQPLVDGGWVTARRHPELPLTIYNYTPRTVYEKHWTPETLACRGLVLDDDDQIVLRPFRKFFNKHELDVMPTGPFYAYEKMDGSLFIAGAWNDRIITATRGSFTSPQAIKGRDLLLAEQGWVPMDGVTYCFEVIYPQNRVVVDYGSEETLVILAIIDNGTGRTVTDWCPPFESARWCDDVSAEYIIQNQHQQANGEGLVLFFPQTDERVKVKFDEYVRLHKILTGINKRHIWERLSAGQSLDPLLERVPDEFYQWVRDTETALRGEFEIIREIHTERFNYLRGSRDRKTFAERAKSTSGGYNLAILFNLYDGKPIDRLIWKMIRPEAEAPFLEGWEA